MYPEQEGYDIQEINRRSGSIKRHYSPLPQSRCCKMANASALNAEATPCSQAINSLENEMDNRTGNSRETEQGTTRCSHPREKEVRQVQIRNLLILILEWKC
jgi:hypothetical protein